MASTIEPTFPLKLMVDKERNRVVLAEASTDFVDTLLSFLTLPLGTIVRLVSKKQTHQAVEVGCINNLYRSVEKFSTDVFWNQICKQMLLFPRNPCETLCQKLKLNVDDTEPTKYFLCSSINCLDGHGRLSVSSFAGGSCFSCGKLMNRELKPKEDSKEAAQRNGVFVEWVAIYLIFDDLKVLQDSVGNSVQQLLQLGYRDFNKLTEMTLNVGLKEILELLKRALISKSPLSDVFLALVDGESKPMCSFSPKTGANDVVIDRTFDLKITMSKTKNKLLYAEVDADFLDFLFSFLTIPLGSILKVFNGNLPLGSMDNLYKSVKSLSSSCLTGLSGTPLLQLQVAPQFGCRMQPLKIYEDKSTLEEKVTLFDPRSPDGKRGSAVGFVRRPSLFVVMDNLQVTPLATTSSTSFLQKLNVPFDDLVEHVVSIGEIEALHLLEASLTSKAALTNGLFYLLEKPKREHNSI